MRVYLRLLSHLLTLTLLGLLISCHDSKPSPGLQTKTDTTALKKDFFPVLNFLKGEIRQVDSTPIGIKRFIIKNGRTDSGYIDRDEFHRLAAEFLDPALQEDRFSDNFQESAFFDKSMNISSFVYTPKNHASSLTRVDVVTRQGESYDEVSSIYLEKNKDSAGSTILLKLYWKPRRQFLINTIIINNERESTNSQIKVVWDRGEY